MRPHRLPLLLGILLAHAAAAKPIEFEFVAPDSDLARSPYARELWADVIAPDGQTLTLPAYYADGGLFAVRARPDQVGIYRFGDVSETTLGVRRTGLIVSLVSPAELQNTARTRLPAVLRNPTDPRKLMRSDGLPFVPVGANLAWAPDGRTDRLGYYLGALPAFAHANLNWMRVWMAHWGGLNLDWLPKDMGPSPLPGFLDEQVAESWDQILAAAEENGVYVQVVLQHHGQFNTTNNSNWAGNPWNSANRGGFLKSPADFFTDPNAQVLTVLKYRYIVARWGWSPAVFAWELFNEVHWTDAFKQGREADVARWHDSMARSIRAVDVYGHLVTTSTENLRSPIYAKMDFFQPHLYAANLIAGARSFDPPGDTLDRPVFYGEMGEDHEPFTEEVKKAGLNIVPPVWASIMGQGAVAAQPWNGWQLLEQKRLDQVGAVFRFLALNRVAAQQGLRPFSAVVECPERAPLRIAAGQVWQRRAAPDFTFPVDGTEPIEAANVPAILVGSPASVAEGFPDRETYHLELPARATLRVRVGSMGAGVAGLRVSVDGRIEATHRWDGASGAPNPAELAVDVGAGPHTLLLENPGPEWIGVPEIDLGMDVSALALAGRRNDRFIEAWIWHRKNLYSLNPSAPVQGTVDLDGVPAGSWKVTWWDTLSGAPSPSRLISHPGGMLKLPTPPIGRDAAVVLTRAD
ncbi:MAG TPA: cellulase family glycosylhydrolase [Opitutaceae bacterium]|nr:cellulase family glycosylhydrolase [Opitutaceae bacterium]